MSSRKGERRLDSQTSIGRSLPRFITASRGFPVRIASSGESPSSAQANHRRLDCSLALSGSVDWSMARFSSGASDVCSIWTGPDPRTTSERLKHTSSMPYCPFNSVLTVTTGFWLRSDEASPCVTVPLGPGQLALRDSPLRGFRLRRPGRHKNAAFVPERRPGQLWAVATRYTAWRD